MNQETFNQAFSELTPKQKKVLTSYLNGDSDDKIIQALQAHDRTLVTQHLRNISKKFQIIPANDSDYKNTLVELCWKNKPELVSPERLKQSGIIGDKPPYPDGPIRTGSPFYIERPPVETKCFNSITEIGSLLRISSPPKMGKTSLIKRIVKTAKEKQYQTVTLDLSLLETEKFTNTEVFLQSFCQYINQELGDLTASEWQLSSSAMLSCTATVGNLLAKLDTDLVLIIDEADKIFDYPEIYKNFFPMLRHWYQQSNELEIWEKLRLVIAYATDDYGRLDLRQSPFNVGLPIKLEELSVSQAETLAYRHGLGQEPITALMKIIGGHPYLLRLALYYLYYEQISLKTLLREASTDSGIYQNHLRELMDKLEQQPELKQCFKLILRSQAENHNSISSINKYQLTGMGLTKLEHDTIKIRFPLYQQFFQERL